MTTNESVETGAAESAELGQQITKDTLREMQKVDPKDVSEDDLVDLRDVVINRNLPIRERFLDFVRQVKNPYLFKVGKIVVKIDEGTINRSFAEALALGLLRS